ncbi:MAG TPA: hypothetical protein VJ550_17275 [Geomonas sp.]|nr:hypothetical protein [Geomonas sp.]
MFDSPFMLVVGTCLFMVAAFIVCVVISIFCDSINLGGSFQSVCEKAIALVFVPILAIGGALDIVVGIFDSAEIKHALNSKV